MDSDENFEGTAFMMATLLTSVVWLVVTVVASSCEESVGFKLGQTEAIQGKYYFQGIRDADGNTQWVQSKTPTTQPVIK